MLEGKAPMDLTAMAVMSTGGSAPIIQQKIVYVNGQNK